MLAPSSVRRWNSIRGSSFFVGWALQKEIGDIAGVADVTIRQSYKLMYPRAADLFPDDFKFVTPIEQLPQA